MMIDLFFSQATSYMLIGWWMALIMLATFAAWGWLVSSKLDKDADYFHLNRDGWNYANLGAGFVALMAMLLVPWPGVNWLVGVIILLTPVLIYWKVRNAAVPEAQRFYLTSKGLQQRLESRKQAKASGQALLEFTDSEGRKRNAPTKEEEHFATHMLVEDCIGPALEARARRLDIQISKTETTMVQTVDGVPYKRSPLGTDQGIRVLDFIKELSGLDIQDRRKKQTGTFHMHSPKGKVEVDVVTQGSSNGVVLRVYFDRSKSMDIPFDNLGFIPAQIESLNKFDEAHERHGIILVGAPSGHGLSTTMYSLLARHDAYTANIKTLEREVLREIPGVDHVEWDPSNPDVDYATNLQSILRRDPDIVMTSYVEDHDTARVITEPGMQGPLIYVPQRAPSIAAQIQAWVKAVGDVKQATNSLRVVINQRLVRRLSDATKQPYKPSDDQLRKLNLPREKVSEFYKANGQILEKNKLVPSPICGGTGYLGQIGVFEVMIVDREARKLLGDGDLKGALAHARRNKMIFLQEAAISRVVSGETTLEELARISGQPTKAAAPKQAPTAAPSAS